MDSEMDSNSMWETLADIIKRFDVETLETRNSSKDDFYELPVWLIKEAMEAAYTAGHEVGKKLGVDELMNDKENDNG